MALILAVNPGNAHNPTLSRLARELKGCEIIGAESCAVAIKAIKKRVPDILLMPAARPRGEADLRAQLRKIPGGVPTLTLPPVETADPLDLARQIRELLTGTPAPVRLPAPIRSTPTPTPARVTPAVVRSMPAPVSTHPPPPPPPLREAAPAGASPQLLAAGAAAVSWIRVRRAQWAEPIEPYNFEPHAPDARIAHSSPVAPIAPSAPSVPSAASVPEPEYYEPIELPEEPHEIYGTEPEDASGASRTTGMARFLPRAAAIAVALGLAGTAAWYWSQRRDDSNNQAETASSPSEVSKPAETNTPPGASELTAKPEPQIEATLITPPPVPVTVVSPFEVSISEGGQPVSVDAQGRAMLVPGKHRLRFQNSERGYDETRTLQVRPGEPATVTLSPETTIAVTSSEPAEVLIDGTRVGETPYNGKLSLGAHTVTVRTAGAERQSEVNATSKPVQLEVDFSKP